MTVRATENGESCSLCNVKCDSAAVVLMENRHCLYSRLKDSELSGAGIIIPLRHCESPFDLTKDEWTATQDLLIRARQLIDQEFHPDGYNIGWNCKEAGGQFLKHAHLHLIPRFFDEPFAGKGIRHWFKLPENRRHGPKFSQVPCSDIVSLEVRDGEVISAGTNWVYVWRETSDAATVVRIGSTWLHPAARTAKHVSETDPGKIDVVAFSVPEGVDRGRARDFLAQALSERGYLGQGAVVGSGSSSFSDRIDKHSNEAEKAFIELMLKHLEKHGGDRK